jgi:DNA-binding NarL/FixJ family response regulator
LSAAGLQAETVLVAERNDFVVTGVRELLSGLFSNVFVVSDAPSLLKGAVRLRPTMVVMDMSTVNGCANACIRQIREDSRSAVIVLTLHDAPSVAKELLEAGADGVVLKHRLAIDLLTAVDTVLEGGRFVSSGIALRSLGLPPRTQNQ